MDFYDINLYDNSNPENNIITNELHLFFQEVELAIKLKPFEVFGQKDSINLNRYLFNRYVSITQIKNDILNYVGKNCAHAKMFKHNVSVETIKSPDNKDMIYIKFSVFANNQFDVEEEFFQKFILGKSTI